MSKCKFLFHRAIFIQNNISEELKYMTKNKFKKNIKEYIRSNYEPKTIPKLLDERKLYLTK